MQIRWLTNRDPEFYSTLGPFLARRDVEKEIGYRVYDDDDKQWVVAQDGDHVIGFCYRQKRPRGRYQIGSCYVIEEYRRKGVFRALLREALSGIDGNVSLTTKNSVLAEFLQSEGFVELHTKGSFIEYGKEINHGV